MKLLPEFPSRSGAGGKTSRRLRGSGTVLLALGMLVLIIAQLSWWLIFFQRNQSRTFELQQQLDRLRIAAANGELETGGGASLQQYDEHLGDQSPLALFADGRYGLNPAELNRRDSATKRAFFMLVSETIFVILVCSYGTFRVLRTILRERRLGHERQIFIDSVTHELKTPLASILLNLQTILKRDPPKDDREELIRDSVDDVRRLEEQLNNILLSGRLGRRQAKDENVGAGSEAATEAVGAIRNFFQENTKRFEQAGLIAELDLPDQLRLRIDLDGFRTILSNLLQNTIQYAGDSQPRMRISTRSEKQNREAVLIFQDAGPGIPPGERENVFQPFYRLSEGQRPVRGSGMGLYLVRELARSVGGEARIVDAPEPAAGTGVEVRLPLAKIDPALAK
ncbi:MAG: HAMP domain-containing histidine kinase [bacterium]|nr:HAMP domain-containing histidine kinase [bacterium]